MSDSSDVTGNNRFSLATLLLFMGAMPLWAWLIYSAGNSPGFGPIGFVVASFTLVAATAAFSFLFRNVRNGLAISSLLAGVVLVGALLIVAAISARA